MPDRVMESARYCVDCQRRMYGSSDKPYERCGLCSMVLRNEL